MTRKNVKAGSFLLYGTEHAAKKWDGKSRKSVNAIPHTCSTVVPGFTNTGCPSTNTSIWLLAAVAVVRPEGHGERKQKQLSPTAGFTPSDPPTPDFSYRVLTEPQLYQQCNTESLSLQTEYACVPFNKWPAHTFITTAPGINYRHLPHTLEDWVTPAKLLGTASSRSMVLWQERKRHCC